MTPQNKNKGCDRRSCQKAERKSIMKKSIVYMSDDQAMVTKAFMKQAAIFGTEEFKLWREYKKEFPKAQMVTKSIKKNPNQKNRRNMTFENLEAYIATQPDAKALKKEFETIKQRSQIQKSPYQYVLSWFEAKFEGYNDLKQFMAEKETERKAKEAAEKEAAAAGNND